MTKHSAIHHEHSEFYNLLDDQENWTSLKAFFCLLA